MSGIMINCCRGMRLVGVTLALVAAASGQACTFLDGADQHISLMVSFIIKLIRVFVSPLHNAPVVNKDVPVVATRG